MTDHQQNATIPPELGQHTLSPLGKPATYISEYDPSLLFPIPRLEQRTQIGLTGTLPFFGLDIWNAYEVSWLNLRGKPQIAIATFIVPANSASIIESKSFKLYLNSLNQTRFADSNAVLTLLKHDISVGFGAPVQIKLSLPDEFSRHQHGELEGILLDRLDIEITQYHPETHHLRTNRDSPPVEETLVSHLLKSNCLVTGQPDWGSVQIHYVGAQIDQEG